MIKTLFAIPFLIALTAVTAVLTTVPFIAAVMTALYVLASIFWLVDDGLEEWLTDSSNNTFIGKTVNTSVMLISSGQVLHWYFTGMQSDPDKMVTIISAGILTCWTLFLAAYIAAVTYQEPE